MYRLLTLLCLICAVNGFKKRIIGGQDEKIEYAPYQVDILNIFMKHVCGGTILSRNYVLTAQHCVENETQSYYLRIGATTLTDKGNLHWIWNITRHENYIQDKFDKNDNDLALIKVTPPFVLDNRTKKAIQLIDRPVKQGDIAFLTGWGTTRVGGRPSQTLQSLEVRVINTKKCEDNYRDLNGLKKYNFCAEHLSKMKGFCNGDSGGPLVINNKLAGIVSWSYGCAQRDRPGVYIDVFKYRDWIHQHMI